MNGPEIEWLSPKVSPYTTNTHQFPIKFRLVSPSKATYTLSVQALNRKGVNVQKIEKDWQDEVIEENIVFPKKQGGTYRIILTAKNKEGTSRTTREIIYNPNK